MSGTKFFIHGGGTWREVDENNGRVSGWGKIQFVYLSRGRLVVARRNSVLRGLRALLAGKTTTVRDGPRLQVIRPKKTEKKEQRIQQNESNHCNCCTCQHTFHHNHNHQSATDILFDKLLKQNTTSTATQCVLTVDDSVKVVQNPLTGVECEKHTETEESEYIGAKTQTADKVPRKELIIDEDDVVLVRTFIEHDERNIFNVSLVDYDADDNCKRSVFYKINPLVVVEKSSRIAQMIRPPSQCSSVSLKEFIAHLGLQSIHEVSKKSKYKMRKRKSRISLKDGDTNESDTDKENIKSTIRSNTTHQQERNFMKKSLHVQKDNKISNLNRNEKKAYYYEPLKLTVNKYPLRKFSGIKNNSLLNMARRFRSGKNIKNKNEAGNSVDDSKKNSEEKTLPKLLKSRRDTADKTLLTRSKNNNVSLEVSSDSESLADKEKQNSLNMSRTMRTINRNRSAATIDKNSKSTKESRNISAINNNKQTIQLSQSLPTKSTRNKITELPFEPSSDEDTCQKDKTSEKPKIRNGIKQSSDTTSKQQKSKPKGGGDKKTSEKPNSTSKGQSTKESRNISAIDNNKQTIQLSQSFPTRSTRNKISELPCEPSSDEDTFQKDKTSEKTIIRNGIKQSSDTTSKQQKSKLKGSGDKKTSEKPNTTSKGVLRAYSRAEDEAIVSWLKTDDRANLVNGNRIWKELKPIHHKTTGHHRPWQSLRNRYLRYILPALGSLAVPPALAQRLRAAAAQGEIKSRSNSNSANNSIFKSAPVRSAWALRPKSPDRSPPSPHASSRTPRPSTPSRITSKSLRSRSRRRTLTPTASTSKSTHQLDKRKSNTSDTSGASRALSKRTLRSSAAHSPTLPTPKAKNRRDSLTYSELTRRFASRHRSTPQSDSSVDTRGEKRLLDTSDSSENSDDNAERKRVTRNDSKVSPSLISGSTFRRSKRFRSRSITPERPRTRRLYNPRAV